MNYQTGAMITRLAQMAVIETLFTTMVIRIGPRALDRLIKTRISLFITGKRSSNNNQSAFGEVAWLN
jgi:DNA-binding MurR/RpiR family transcriptional regulator